MHGSWIVVVAVLLAGCADEPKPSPTAAATPAGTSVAVRASPSPSGCAGTPVWIGAAPDWTASARLPGNTPYVLSHEGNLVGVLFGGSLRAGANVTDPSNKILWVSRQPRGHQPLRLTLRAPDGIGDPVTEPADSSPGEIYPSLVDPPRPGCWLVQAAWNGQTATLELFYR